MAFLQAPRPRREPALRAPASVLVLIALLIGAHAARVYAPAHLSDEILNRFALVPAYFSSAWLAAHHMAQPPWYALALPFVGSMMFISTLMVVVFPAPLAPMSAYALPGGTVKLSPRRASFRPYRFHRSLT